MERTVSEKIAQRFFELETFLARRAGAATASTQFITNDSHKLGIKYFYVSEAKLEEKCACNM